MQGRTSVEGSAADGELRDGALADMFFDYLRDILESPVNAKLDIDRVPKEWQDFAKGLIYFDECLLQIDTFSRELAQGNLDAPLPSAENGLSGPLKSLQSNLSHLAWQATEVSNGNYQEHVDFMNDLGKAFNTMVDKLSDRETALEREKESLAQANRELKSTHEMMTALALDSTSFVLIYDDESKKEVFSSEMADTFMSEHPRMAEEISWTLKYCSSEVYEHAIHWSCSFSGDSLEHPVLRLAVSSHSITWNGRRAIAHMVVDDTQTMENELAMQALAYRDPLTDLFNRRYGMEEANRLMQDNIPFCLAFIDLDNLKFCNDSFGHEAGDDYIMSAADQMRTVPNPRVICRIGGDEFMVIAKRADKDQIIQCLKNMNLALLLESAEKNSDSTLHYRTLSYGVVEVPTKPDRRLADYLKDADAIMYTRKKRHKSYLEAKTSYTPSCISIDTAHHRNVEK